MNFEPARTLRAFAILTSLVALAACGGGGGSPSAGTPPGGGSPPPGGPPPGDPPPPTTFVVGGTVGGLNGTVVLRNNGGDELSVTTIGAFRFVTKIATGGAYNVTVQTQPINQRCTLTGNTGTVNAADVTSVVVTCTTNPPDTHTVGGSVTGLNGTLVLTNTPGTGPSEDVTLNADGTFTFAPLARGTTYAVTVKTQPANQTCEVANGAGTIDTADVTNVTVTCRNPPAAFSVGGRVSGLAGSGLVLQNNGGDDLPIPFIGAGEFTFETKVPEGGAYDITVLKQPADPVQICVVANGTGDVSGGPVNDVIIECVQPVARFSYVTNALDDSVSVFTVDAATGQLRHRGHVPTGETPETIVVKPASNVACVMNRNATSLSTFTIDAATGALTPAGEKEIGGFPSALAMHPTGAFVIVAYVSEQGVSSLAAFAIRNDGELSLLEEPEVLPARALSVTVSGAFVYVAIDGDPSILTFISGIGGVLAPAEGVAGVGTGRTRLAAHPSGRFIYAATEFRTVSAYSIQDDGALEPVGPAVDVGGVPMAITADPSGRFVYVTTLDGADGGKVTGFPITDGALGQKQELPLGLHSVPTSVSVDPSGHFAFVTDDDTNTISTFEIDPTNAALHLVRTVAGRLGPAAMAMAWGTSPVTHEPHFAFTATRANLVISLGIDPGSGLVAPLGVDAADSLTPRSIAVDPFGKFAFVADAGAGNQPAHVRAWNIESSGLLSNVRQFDQPNTRFSAVAADPSGRYFYATNLPIGADGADVGIFAFSTSPDAPLAPIGLNRAVGTAPSSIAIDPAGRFVYVSDAELGAIAAFAINRNGSLRTITEPDFTVDGSVSSVAVDPSGRFVYAPDSVARKLFAFEIQGNGSLAPKGDGVPTLDPLPHSVTVDPRGRFVYVAGPGGTAAPTDDTVQVFRIMTDGSVERGASVFVQHGAAFVTADPSGEFIYAMGSVGITPLSINPDTGALTALTPFQGVPLGENSVAITTVVH